VHRLAIDNALDESPGKVAGKKHELACLGDAIMASPAGQWPYGRRFRSVYFGRVETGYYAGWQVDTVTRDGGSRRRRQTVPAYLVGQIDVTDPERYQEYRAQVPAVLAKYGGRFLVRGPQVTVLEGKYDGQRLVVIEFPSMAQLEAFYRSPEYAPLITLRTSASTGNMWAVPGV
jgi:uncharacterized protein (DUF1330 family)